MSLTYRFDLRYYSSTTTANDLKWWQKILKRPSIPQVAVIPVQGMIVSNKPGLKYVNTTIIRDALTKINGIKNLKAIALEINSSGGSATQSDLIRNEIQDVAERKKVPVLSFVEDTALSGGYYIACTGEKIYVNKNSVVGSIGVLYATFGLNRFIERYDIERRALTAGKNKLAHDIFQAQTEESRHKMELLIGNLHQEFIDVVRQSRGSRLKENKVPLFEGDFWTAREAVELGLVDDLYTTTESTLKKEFGPKVTIKRIDRKKSFLEILQLDRGASSFLDADVPSSGSEEDIFWRRLLEMAVSSSNRMPRF